jgi:ABC-type transport system substrate-binding protein
MAVAGRAGGGKTPLELWYPTGGSWAALMNLETFARAIGGNLASVGFQATLKTEPAAQFATDAAAGKFQMWLSSTDCVWDSADYFVDTAFFHYNGSTPSPQFAYANDTLNATMTSAVSALTDADAKSGWHKAQDLIAADMPTVPLVHAKLPAASRSYVHGVLATGSMVEILNTVWLDK